MTIQHGAGDELSDIDPGTCRFRLKNPDGRFTLGRTDGPYGAGVVPGKRLLVVLDYSGVAYVRFDGHVNNWPTVWDESLEVPIGEVTATDPMKRGGPVAKLRSMLEQETLACTPSVYYPLGEAEGVASVGSIAATVQPGAALQSFDQGGGLIEFGRGTGPGTDAISAPVFTPNGQIGGQYLVGTGGRAGSATGSSLSIWFATSNLPAPGPVAMCALTNRGGDGLVLGEHTNGAPLLYYHAHGEPVLSFTSPKAAHDARIHQAVATLSRSGSTVTARLYVDGLLRASATMTGDPLPVWSRFDIGASHLGAFAPWFGTLAHYAAFDFALSATQVDAMWQAGKLGLIGERTDQRMHRIADWAELPASRRAFDVGDKRMGAQNTAGKGPLEAFRDVERVEQGRVFYSRDGLLTFHSRARRYNRPPDITLDVAAGEVQVPASYPGDDLGMVNDFEVSRPDGATQRIVDQDSVDAYGVYTDSLEVPAESDRRAQSVGEWRVGTYGQPLPRFPSLTVMMAKLHLIAPSKVAQLLSAEISSVIEITNLPEQAPLTDDQQVIEGWTETLGVGIWSMVFNCSPHSVNQVWILGTSQLGVDTRLAL